MTHIIIACMALQSFIKRSDIGDEELLLFNDIVELDYSMRYLDENVIEDVTWD